MRVPAYLAIYLVPVLSSRDNPHLLFSNKNTDANSECICVYPYAGGARPYLRRYQHTAGRSSGSTQAQMAMSQPANALPNRKRLGPGNL